MLGPFATASRRTPIHRVSLLSHAALSHAACASMSTTTTTTTRNRGDRYGPIEWAQKSQGHVGRGCMEDRTTALPPLHGLLYILRRVAVIKTANNNNRRNFSTTVGHYLLLVCRHACVTLRLAWAYIVYVRLWPPCRSLSHHKIV